MSIDSDLLPVWLAWGLFIPSALLLLWSAFNINFTALKEKPVLQHVFYVVCFGLAMLWCIRTGISSGLGIHFMGLTAATLLMGWPLALIGGAAALLWVTLLGLETYGNFGVNFIVSVALPVVSSHFILCQVQKRLPANPFVYIFLAGFLNGALSIVCVVVATSLMLGLLDIYSWENVYENYFMYLPLMLFPEAFVNGMIIGGVIATKPELLSSFNVDEYFDG
jgi:uncharacterized membrane protein